MNALAFPSGYRIERIGKSHPRQSFSSGQPAVDDWLRTKALQNQDKRLSVTRILLDESGAIAGFYTLVICQVDFGNLPPDETKKLPRRALPIAFLAWLGVSSDRQGQGLGKSLLVQALRDCYEAGQTFSFVAVVLDCIDDRAKAFYKRFDFADLPGQTNRLYLSAERLEAMMRSG